MFWSTCFFTVHRRLANYAFINAKACATSMVCKISNCLCPTQKWVYVFNSTISVTCVIKFKSYWLGDI
uniref:Uncharacterized protein n=1 Tax=Anguilla anguilla TaxID=7936 RepID=A0A0E9SJZ8_ANGAN